MDIDDEDREWPGWGEDDWDDDIVRADLMWMLATHDGTTDIVVIARRHRQIRMWAAIEGARARVRGRSARESDVDHILARESALRALPCMTDDELDAQLDALMNRCREQFLAWADRHLDTEAGLREILDRAGIAHPYAEDDSPAGEVTDHEGT